MQVAISKRKAAGGKQPAATDNGQHTTDKLMPKLVIDDREIEVAPQTMVIEAAAQLGIMIPRFCYHPALGSVGACRVCAVKFLAGPLKGIQMSCMVEAQDGMVVSTTDEEAMDFRKHVIEWLMLNHPHDCPVCDEGGHCLLQDMTVSGGHGIRRYAGLKRTYIDQYLGPLVQHEMNRCIHCYRCARYYQEFTGYRDLGVMRNANRTYFGRFQDGILESPFSGNLSDICPTGVYTDKPSRFFGRRWDYQRNPCICINCSLGCHTVASVRYREVKRQEARFSEQVNGYFICDRGRYGFIYGNLESRPRHASVNGEPVSYDQALQTAIAKLGKTGRESGPSGIAAAGSARSSLETQFMLKHLCQVMGWRKPVYFMDPAATSKVKTSIARLEPELAVSLREVENSDFILCLGADPINEAPMLAMAMRQAQRNGAKIVVVDPRPVFLPLDFDHLVAGLDDMSGLVGLIIKAVVDRGTVAACGERAANFFDGLPDWKMKAGFQEDLLTAAAADLKKSQRPVVVCGSDIVPDQMPGIAADLALFLRTADKKAGLFYLLPGANAFGAGLLSDDRASLLDIIEAIENGDVKSLILAESDPFFHCSDRKRLERALDALDLLVVLDYINTDAAQKAHIFLPSSTLYETDGIFVNQEGRAQLVRQASSGGVPIVQSGAGDHPPRLYGTGLPGSDPRPAWLSLARLAEDKIKPEKVQPPAIYQWLADIIPELADFSVTANFPHEGIRLDPGANTDLRFTADFSRPPEEQREGPENLKIVLIDLTFGTEALSSHSECLQQLETEPLVFMNSSEAERLNLSDGDRVSVQTESGNLEARLKAAENMAAGVLVIPRLRKLAWQIFKTGTSSIDRDQIKKVDV
jgi:NADH-quinone oxidoreductase subunit G